MKRTVALAAVWMLGGLATTALAAEGGLLSGSAEAGKTKAAVCSACHGQTGNAVAPNWPNLASQNPTYIVKELKAYKNGERTDATMVGFASTLNEADMHDIAAYFASQTLNPQGADPKLVAQGEAIYRGGIPEKNVPACSGCHGPTGQGNLLAAYPQIAGQNQQYMMDTLKAFADGTRRSDPNKMMRDVASRLTEDEMRAVTSYVQGLQTGNP